MFWTFSHLWESGIILPPFRNLSLCRGSTTTLWKGSILVNHFRDIVKIFICPKQQSPSYFSSLKGLLRSFPFTDEESQPWKVNVTFPTSSLFLLWHVLKIHLLLCDGIILDLWKYGNQGHISKSPLPISATAIADFTKLRMNVPSRECRCALLLLWELWEAQLYDNVANNNIGPLLGLLTQGGHSHLSLSPMTGCSL